MIAITHTVPGYRLAVKNRSSAWSPHPTVTHLVYEVKRATATQVVASNIHNPDDEIRVRIADGRIIGKTGLCGTDFAIDITPEIMAQHDDEVALRRRWIAALRRVSEVEVAINRHALSIEQMEVIATAYEATLQPEAVICSEIGR